MQDEMIATPTPAKRVPWIKGKLTGAKPSDIPNISIENSGKEWAKYEETIHSVLMSPHETAGVPNLLAPSGR